MWYKLEVWQVTSIFRRRTLLNRWRGLDSNDECLRRRRRRHSNLYYFMNVKCSGPLLYVWRVSVSSLDGDISLSCSDCAAYHTCSFNRCISLRAWVPSNYTTVDALRSSSISDLVYLSVQWVLAWARLHHLVYHLFNTCQLVFSKLISFIGLISVRWNCLYVGLEQSGWNEHSRC